MSESEKFIRFSVSLPEDLLKEFDKVTETLGIQGRSDAIRKAMRDFIVNYTWMDRSEGSMAGSITVVLDHETAGIMDDLTELQHKYINLIASSMHVHLDEHDCMIVLAVRGNVEGVEKLNNELLALKGVKLVKYTIMTPGAELP
ncbi:MAG: nickel-responsive transcriptional regulator NikR [Candidatus Lokiarchaeia archaeon]